MESERGREEEGREGKKDRGIEGPRDGGRDRGTEGGRDGETEDGRQRQRGEREADRQNVHRTLQQLICNRNDDHVDSLLR